MAKVLQQSLFTAQSWEKSSDIVRLREVIDSLDDDKLIAALEKKRGGRNDKYSIPAAVNSLYAQLIFGISMTTELIRELRRNSELRDICGFESEDAIPSPYAYSRLRKNVADLQCHLDAVFAGLRADVAEALPDYGRLLVMDGKAITVHSKADKEATEGRKEQRDEEGNVTVSMSWNGFRLHAISDATYGLPVLGDVTTANVGEQPRALPMVEKLQEEAPVVYERIEAMMADMGYDTIEIKTKLQDEHGIAPVIPARELAKEPKPLDERVHDTIYIQPNGEVTCKVQPFATDPEQAFARMQFQGFEPGRDTLKFRCPAAAFGLTCENQGACRSAAKDTGFGRTLRIPLERNRRLHTAIPVGSQKFQDLYDMRTSIERMFFRLDHLYGVEMMTVRGLARVRAQVTMAFIAMMAAALHAIRRGEPELMRSRMQRVA